MLTPRRRTSGSLSSIGMENQCILKLVHQDSPIVLTLYLSSNNIEIRARFTWQKNFNGTMWSKKSRWWWWDSGGHLRKTLSHPFQAADFSGTPSLQLSCLVQVVLGCSQTSHLSVRELGTEALARNRHGIIKQNWQCFIFLSDLYMSRQQTQKP